MPRQPRWRVASQIIGADQREWIGAIYRRAHGHTYFVFVSPGNPVLVVWVTNRMAVSDRDRLRL